MCVDKLEDMANRYCVINVFSLSPDEVSYFRTTKYNID